MKLRIVSNGVGTRVQTEDGRAIENLVEVRFVHRQGELPQAMVVVRCEAMLDADLRRVLIDEPAEERAASGDE